MYILQCMHVMGSGAQVPDQVIASQQDPLKTFLVWPGQQYLYKRNHAHGHTA